MPGPVPPLRLHAGNGAGQPTTGGDCSGSYSDDDDDDFIDEELEGSVDEESTSLQKEGGFDPIPAGPEPRDADVPPTRGRAPPNFPARPRSPQPQIQSPVPSPGRGRGKGGKGQVVADEEDEESWDSQAQRNSTSRGRTRHEQPGRRVGTSAPELGGHGPDVPDEVSEISGQPEQGEGEMDPEQQEGQEGAYPSQSWRETLSRFPSLLRLYPLAAASEAALDDPNSERDGGQGGGSNLGPVDQLEGNEEYLNSHPGSSSQGLQQPQAVHPQGPVSPARSAQPSTPRQPSSPHCEQSEWQARTMRPSSQGTSVPTTPTRLPVGPERVQATPRSAPPRAAWWPHALPRRGAWFTGNQAALFQGPPGDLADAWAEVEAAQRSLEQRARDVELREAAVRRAEMRNAASARALDEQRRRLEDYSEELEEGMVALSAQQSSLREERRQAAELQARARRMFATAARDDLVAMKGKRDWERWSPPGAAGGT